MRGRRRAVGACVAVAAVLMAAAVLDCAAAVDKYEKHCDSHMRRLDDHGATLEQLVATFYEDSDGLPLRGVGEASLLGNLKRLADRRHELRKAVAEFDRYDCERTIFVEGHTELDVSGFGDATPAPTARAAREPRVMADGDELQAWEAEGDGDGDGGGDHGDWEASQRHGRRGEAWEVGAEEGGRGAASDEWEASQQQQQHGRRGETRWAEAAVQRAEARLLYARRWLDTHDDERVDVHHGAGARLKAQTGLNIARLKHLLVRALGYSEAAQTEEWLLPLLSTEVIIDTGLPITVARAILHAAVQLNGGNPIP
mmetsp:Transcript_20591/g.72719  ORF Transcript_20591/g.72719 Transcript_20591/m.72719 type:complete len:313 (-) Transcript_20591:31-969(-)